MPSYILQKNNEYHPGNIQRISAFTLSAWELKYFPKNIECTLHLQVTQPMDKTFNFDIKNYHEIKFSSELKAESNLMFVI